jgi:predicted ATP-dependent endonuclease of OLD family
MSDGYRSLIALIVDILRHMIKCFGVQGLAEKVEGGYYQCTRSGVVLIDEIDAHLHPEWQREIGFWLKKHFPKVQFIVTTHSPFVCQAADKRGIIVLPEPGSGAHARVLTDEEHRQIVGSRTDKILLSPAFGLENTRSESAVIARAETAKFRAKKKVKPLTKEERERESQLEFFVVDDE